MTTTLAPAFEAPTFPTASGPTPAAAHRGRVPQGGPRPGGAGRSPGQQLGLSWSADGPPGPAPLPSEPSSCGRAEGRAPGASSVRAAAPPSTPESARAGSGPRTRPPGPRRPGPRPGTAPAPRSAIGLLRQATEGVAEAHELAEPVLRYPAAYLAALRAGAAVLAVRATTAPKRGASRSVWALLADVAPEFGEWAAYFASCSSTRAAAEAGISRLVGQRDADDLVRQAEQFVALVGEQLSA